MRSSHPHAFIEELFSGDGVWGKYTYPHALIEELFGGDGVWDKTLKSSHIVQRRPIGSGLHEEQHITPEPRQRRFGSIRLLLTSQLSRHTAVYRCNASVNSVQYII